MNYALTCPTGGIWSNAALWTVPVVKRLMAMVEVLPTRDILIYNLTNENLRKQMADLMVDQNDPIFALVKYISKVILFWSIPIRHCLIKNQNIFYGFFITRMLALFYINNLYLPEFLKFNYRKINLSFH